MKQLNHYLTESRLPDEALKLADDGSYANPQLASDFYRDLAEVVKDNQYLFEMARQIEETDMLREIEDGEEAMDFIKFLRDRRLDFKKVINGLNNYADHLEP